MKREVIIACDFKNREDTLLFLKKLDGEKPFLKIGMELYYREGAPLVRELKEKGYKIFLDLKLHDIPNTVYKAMKNLGKIGVDMTNVHAAGGIEMMRAAARGLQEGSRGDKALLIAVTQLTSTDQRTMTEELLIDRPLPEVVRAYALNAKAAGLDGVVCSPLEAPVIGELGLISVTPGIRLAEDAVGDQKRVTSPDMARELGSTFIVVGRTITGTQNPLERYLLCKKMFE